MLYNPYLDYCTVHVYAYNIGLVASYIPLMCALHVCGGRMSLCTRLGITHFRGFLTLDLGNVDISPELSFFDL